MSVVGTGCINKPDLARSGSVDSVLLCTVRGCGGPLLREERRLLCPNGHCFDIARRGYVNLLQPQDRRSAHPGDNLAAMHARRRLHDAGVTQPLLAAIAELAGVARHDLVLDAGCGEGFYAGQLAQQAGCRVHGIDISLPAIQAAASRYPQCHWAVANADRFIPCAKASFSLVTSITARMNSAEFRRIVRDDGRLLVAIPSPEDLIELRRTGRDRVPRTIATFADRFALDRQHRVTTTAQLDAAAMSDVLASIYRPLQGGTPAALRLTFSLDLLLFRPV